jgi:uncharacterized protein YpmB
MADVRAVQQAGAVSQPYTPKQLLGRLKTFEDIADTVLYVPFVYNLIRDQQRTAYATDLFSHSLAQVLGNHPLIITELASKVFEAQPPILLTPEQKTFERTIYITSKPAWETVINELKMVTAVDKATHRFCVFRMYEEEIACPLGNYQDRMVKVWYCNLYGNHETYYYIKGTDEKGGSMMHLHYAPPIKEFVTLGDKLLGLLHETKAEEAAYETFVEETEKSKASIQLLALQKNSKLQQAIAAKPLEESQLSVKQRADCYEMIRLYYQLYGQNNE